MLCERCNEREATIHYTELVNGVRSEHHICSECASKLMPAEYGSMFGADMPFAKFLTGLLRQEELMPVRRMTRWHILYALSAE